MPACKCPVRLVLLFSCLQDSHRKNKASKESTVSFVQSKLQNPFDDPVLVPLRHGEMQRCNPAVLNVAAVIQALQCAAVPYSLDPAPQ